VDAGNAEWPFGEITMSATVATIDLPEVTEMRNVKVKDAATIMACSRSKVYDLMSEGRLRSMKIDGARRIPLSAIREFLANPNGSAE